MPESMYPLLSPMAVSQLRLRRPDTSRVNLLLRPSDDLLNRLSEFAAADSVSSYCQQASKLSAQLQFASGRIGCLYVLGRLHSLPPQDTSGRASLRLGIRLSQHQGPRRLETLGWCYLADCYT